ncbi:MAG: hypothetical protein K2L38_00100, partial [Dysosmobacter sp.]|nr:hypothetical protein [Dysosmobacter sp.]
SAALAALTQPGGDLDQALAGLTISKAQITDFPSALAPTAHAASHGSGGTDPITPAGIGAAAAGHTHNYAGSAAPGGAATSAARLSTARAIDGMSFDGSAGITHFGTCSTAAATAAKTVALTGFTLAAGARIAVKFTAANTAANPTLNVNSTGAKAMVKYGTTAVDANAWPAGAVVELIYDGASWVMLTETASRLAVPRSIRVNLASTSAVNFDGSANITPGVTGILGAANGGTGVGSLAALAAALTGQGVAKIATGSYVGTGTYGVDHPCSITFPFSPIYVQIVDGSIYDRIPTLTWGYQYAANDWGYYNGIYCPALTTDYVIYRGFGRRSEYGIPYGKISPDGKTLHWYSTYNRSGGTLGPEEQYNVSGKAYHWIAFG